MWFKVYTKVQDNRFFRDYFWAPKDAEPTVRDEHGPYPLRSVAWLAGLLAWVRGGGS